MVLIISCLCSSCNRLQSCRNFWAKRYSAVTEKAEGYRKMLFFGFFV
nr:MAG TPA: hypothetical protein [Caudoviricetes sp.]